MSEIETQLASGLAELGLDLGPEVQARLLAYLTLLAKWNKTYNLTAITEPSAMVSHHLLDSLAILPHLPENRLIDVGTGAGLPGLPLAIARPERAITLLDSNAKKTRFLVQAVGELGLANVTVVNERVENHRPEAPYPSIVSRAFASLADMLNNCAHLGGPDSRYYAMKGKYPAEELANLPAGFVLIGENRLHVPGVTGERHLLILGRG